MDKKGKSISSFWQNPVKRATDCEAIHKVGQDFRDFSSFSDLKAELNRRKEVCKRACILPKTRTDEDEYSHNGQSSQKGLS